MRCCYSFFRSFDRNFTCKRVIKFLRKLKEAHLRVLDFKNLKIVKKRVPSEKKTANFPRTVRYVQLCLRANFNNAWENHWKPFFALISVRILLKQLYYSFFISMRRNLLIRPSASSDYHLTEISSS